MTQSTTTAAAGSISEPVARVEAFLETFLDRRPLPANLDQAARYALLGGGKRLRPILVARCCEAVAGNVEAALPAAGAIEMIHCFSLVHDDLPAMDDDDMRRGRPTLHKHTNDAMAILAGDLLNTMAFELLTTTVNDAKLSALLVRELSIATNDMIAGQVYDTMPDFADDVDEMDRLRMIHKNKTGALIRCACRMGAISGGGSAEQLQALTTYGEKIGLMFQVVDDVLDVTQSSEHLGKTAGKDVAQGKTTYPALIGLEASRQQIAELQAASHEALTMFGPAADPLRELCDYMAVRSN